jgi:predicted hydrolase (HD superfamily)
MRAYARKYGEDEERWGVTGLIHDFDYESEPGEHPARGLRILGERGVDQAMLDDIASHAELGVPRDTKLRQALNAVDELCGFIIACALVKPDRSLGAVDARTVRKKMKDKAFARAVNRDDLVQGAEELGMEFDEHVAFTVAAMTAYADRLGLAGVPESVASGQ